MYLWDYIYVHIYIYAGFKPTVDQHAELYVLSSLSISKFISLIYRENPA